MIEIIEFVKFYQHCFLIKFFLVQLFFTIEGLNHAEFENFA